MQPRGLRHKKEDVDETGGVVIQWGSQVEAEAQPNKPEATVLKLVSTPKQ
jgi:hypothetical protein